MHQETAKSYRLHWPTDRQLCFTLVLIRYQYFGTIVSCKSSIWSASGFIEVSSTLIEVLSCFHILCRQFGNFEEYWKNYDSDDDDDDDRDTCKPSLFEKLGNSK
jgi:hypothetical protein